MEEFQSRGVGTKPGALDIVGPLQKGAVLIHCWQQH